MARRLQNGAKFDNFATLRYNIGNEADLLLYRSAFLFVRRFNQRFANSIKPNLLSR